MTTLSSIISSNQSSFPSGTKLLFYQATAPTGWIKDISINDRAIRVVSGIGGVTGGSFSFSSVFTTRTVNGSVGGTSLTIDQIPPHDHGGQTGGDLNNHVHTFTTGSVGDHRHTYAIAEGSSRGVSTNYGVTPLAYAGFCVSELEQSGGPDGQCLSVSAYATVAAGGHNHTGTTDGVASSHSHSIPLQGLGNSHSHSLSLSNLDFDVQYIDVIICAKS